MEIALQIVFQHSFYNFPSIKLYKHILNISKVKKKINECKGYKEKKSRTNYCVL